MYNQCSSELKDKLKGAEGYEVAKKDNNVVKLLTIMQGYFFKFDILNDEYMFIVAVLKNLFFYYYKNDQQNADYHEDFMALVEVIEEYRGAGCVSHFPNMIKIEPYGIDSNADISSAMPDELNDAMKLDLVVIYLVVYFLNGG